MKLENPESYTAKQLVKIILDNGFSSNKASTLLRYSKDDLLRTIDEENDDFRNAQALKDEAATKGFVENFINTLDSIKVERTGTPNNPSAKKICKENLNDEAFISDSNNIWIRRLFAFGALLYLLWDTFDLKSLLKKKEAQNASKQQSLNQIKSN